MEESKQKLEFRLVYTSALISALLKEFPKNTMKSSVFFLCIEFLKNSKKFSRMLGSDGAGWENTHSDCIGDDKELSGVLATLDSCGAVSCKIKENGFSLSLNSESESEIGDPFSIPSKEVQKQIKEAASFAKKFIFKLMDFNEMVANLK